MRARKRTVYRKAALDKLSSPEELDRLMQITGPGSWLLLVALGGVLLMVIGWGVFGQITTTLDRSGLLTLSNPIVFVAAPQNGQVSAITRPGGRCDRRGSGYRADHDRCRTRRGHQRGEWACDLGARGDWRAGGRRDAASQRRIV